jgi:predicted Rossmann fold flavoprotein
MIYKIAIIGAGASGLMFLSKLKKHKRIALIDKNSFAGEKIRVSGGGKCNISNRDISAEHYLGDSEFLENLFKKFDKNWVLDFCRENGFNPKLNEKNISGSYFCNSSKDILRILKNGLKKARPFFNREVFGLGLEDDIFRIKTSGGDIFAEKVVFASGGLSYPNLGATNIAFKIAEKFGHKIEKLNPALVGFTVQKEQFWFKNLSGVSLSAKAKIGKKTLNGDILFTHKGCSGPLILNSSLFWEKGKIELDFMPNFEIEIFLHKKGNISTILPLPKRFLKEFLNSISLKDKSMESLNSDEVAKLKILKNYSFSPAGNFGYSRAEATKGGISTNEIGENFESKLQKNLYFIGENLDITGEVGGYNFYFAFTSALQSALHVH